MKQQETLKQLPAYETAVIEGEYEMDIRSPSIPIGNAVPDTEVAFVVRCGESDLDGFVYSLMGKLMPKGWVEMLPSQIKNTHWLCRLIKSEPQA